MSDSVQPYGPNTAAIRAFLVRFAGLGAHDRFTVVARYQERVNTRTYHVAESAMATAIERSGREPMQQALSGPLLQLVRRADILPATEPTEENALEGLDPVAEPALAALLALLVRDLLDEGQLEQVYGAFSTVIALGDLPR